MKYRVLKIGEVVRPGDFFLRCRITNTWKQFSEDIVNYDIKMRTVTEGCAPVRRTLKNHLTAR